jgi:hypothetical protein
MSIVRSILGYTALIGLFGFMAVVDWHIYVAPRVAKWRRR